MPLLEEVNLDDADAAVLALASHLGGVLAGRYRHDERCFEIVTGGFPASWGNPFSKNMARKKVTRALAPPKTAR